MYCIVEFLVGCLMDFGRGESETQRERCGDAELIVSELRTVGRMDV